MALQEVQYITGQLSEVNQSLSGNLSSIGTISGTLHVVSGIPVHDVYDGAYVIDPLVNAGIELETNGKYCRDDITINRVPRYETTNPAGGLTFYIGEMGG